MARTGGAPYPTITDDRALGAADIQRSLRFNDDDSPSLSRTPSSAGNKKTFTFSCWFKRSTLGVVSHIFAIQIDSSNQLVIRFVSSDKLQIYDYQSSSHQMIFDTNVLFRDVSAWYHLVLAVDTTQSTNTDRFKLYVNSSQVTSFSSSTYPSQYHDTLVNTTNTHYIGQKNSSNYFDGYLAEFNFVDGLQLDPTYFGFTDSQTGIWMPKRFTPPNRPNNGATWSSTTQFDANVFDGDYTDNFLAQESNGYYTATTAPFTIKQSLGVITGDGYHWGARFNGSTEVTTGSLSSIMGHDPDVRIVNFDLSGVTLPLDVTNLQLKVGDGGSGSTYIYGIVVDGVVLIDGDISNIGLNGFRLDFNDNSSTSALGKDISGNGNDFTTNNFSVSSGLGNDSFEDTPTNTFPTLNPNHAFLNGSSSTAENGNLQWNGQSNNQAGCPATMAFPKTGKWYWEVTLLSSNANFSFGITPVTYSNVTNPANPTGSIGYAAYGSKIVSSSETASWAASFSNSDTAAAALDMENKSITFYKNNSAVGSIDLVSGYENVNYLAWIKGDTASQLIQGAINFGGNGFVYTPPTGFKALNSNNLVPHSPSIIRPQKHFETLTYTGNNNSGRVITGLEFKPDFVWFKKRDNGTQNHTLYDSVRGAGKRLMLPSTSGEGTVSDELTSFNKDGFTIDTDNFQNENGSNYVAWCWKAGGAAVSNSDGNITSSVSANQEAGFSIVTYTGNGNSPQTVGHGLGKAPSWVIVKDRSNSMDWVVKHKSLSSNKILYLQSTSGEDTGTGSNNGIIDNLTSATTTTVTLTNNGSGNMNMVNKSSANYVMYCWAEIPGYSKFGSYTGNGSTDGPYVNCGFAPRWCITKRLGTSNWYIWDTARELNVNNSPLQANDAGTEPADYDNFLDILSDGFKLRSSNAGTNGSGDTYIFMAFAEQPGATPYGTFPNAK